MSEVLFEENQELIMERMELSIERIKAIQEEHTVEEIYLPYFRACAKVILQGVNNRQFQYHQYTLEQLKDINRMQYQEFQGEHYQTSFGNPEYCSEIFGEAFGGILSFLYSELQGMYIYGIRNRVAEMTYFMELFIEIYNLFEQQPKVEAVKECIYYFYYDYCDVLVPYRTREMYDSTVNDYVKLVLESDLTDLRYLYGYGAYIGENELKTAAFLNTLSQEEIDALAFTYTDGYREGFEIAKIDLSKKKYVSLVFAIGQERIAKAAIKQFQAMGLEPLIYTPAVSQINRRQNRKNGVFGTSVNKQYEYDHRMDESLYFDAAFMERKLEVLAGSYEEMKEQLRLFAGPAVMETFGEIPFEPVKKKGCLSMSKRQEELLVEYAGSAGKLINTYIPREEYSFTIIAYPIPEIGDNFPEIFREIVKVNTLDKQRYKEIQQVLIQELDKATSVHVVGANGNQTDICVMMHTLEHPETETNFENCLADVNIPVGEVFTSPKLTGTNGILHVSEVYLNDLRFVDLWIRFEDGMIQQYTCRNFKEEEDNVAFVKENLLMNRKTLPIGEFAIGTNTTAYVMANKYDIVYKLPILIVEKMGPHFAVGDTCYSYSENNRLFNPDGKEIVAKDNECSLLRNEDIKKAYFNMHTDITIPYREIGGIYSIHQDGTKVAIMEQGRFVLAGTEELNRPFEA